MDWKEIENYEDKYWVNSIGEVKNKNDLILKQRDNGGGYLIVDLCKNGIKTTHSIGRLVGKAFVAPKHEEFTDIDHIDNDKYNNWVENLRWVNKSGNNRNRPSKNKTGFKGVYERRDLYIAQIRINKRKKHLGSFSTPELAHEAYMNKYEELMSVY